MAALYCRLSRDDGGDAESNSIATQRMMLQRYAKEHGFTIQDEYIDDGFSGTNFQRPNFQRLIADIENGKIGVVLCKDLSRLGRNNALVAYYTEMFFPDNDVRFVAINDAIDTSQGDNEIMPFKSVINEYYARDISKKVRSAKRTRAQNGEHHCGRAPYGYMKSPADKHKLVINEETAQIVRWMFEMASEGLSIYSIATRLYKTKIITPSAYVFQQTGGFQSKVYADCPHAWHAQSVKSILSSQIYIGNMVNHRQTTKSFKNRKVFNVPKDEWIIVEHTHEPIVSAEQFEKVQRLLSIKKRENIRHGTNMFAGLLFCADCGRHLYYQSSMRIRGGGGGFNCDTYRHHTRVGADRRCSSHSIGYNALRDAVLANINDVIRGSINQDECLERMAANQNDDASDDRKALERLKYRDNELKLLIKRVFEQNTLGRISDDTFSELYAAYQTEQKEVRAKIEELETKLTEWKNESGQADRFIEAIKRYTEITRLTREVLVDFTEKIVVYEAMGNHRKGRQQTVDIYYRFVGQLSGGKVSL
jgi:DNA invertase Pin-like site-specific DNA recombinase